MKSIDFKALFAVLLSPIPYFFIFIASIKQPLDADLGWHLKYGEYFYQHFVPLRDNLFSTMMPHYHWPNSSWVTDVMSYTAYHYYGFAGLSILAAIVVTLTFFFFSNAFNLTLLQKSIFFPVILYLEFPINDVSFRGQQLSLLFLALLLFLLETHDKNIFTLKIKRVYLIPPLFFLWGNTHGEFLLGLGILGVWVMGKTLATFLENRTLSQKTRIRETVKSLRFWGVLVIASVAATFINPFGIALYHEAFNHVGNSDLKYITEYVPFKELSTDWRNLFITASLLIFGVCMFFLNGQVLKKLPIIFVILSLFFLTLGVMRFAWPFYYTTPGILMVYLGFDNENYMWSKITGGIIFICLILVIIFFYNPITTVQRYNWNTYCADYVNCSPKSAEFLEKAHLNGAILTNYNWGGWLIWNYPHIKPSIDGRMHLWRDEKGYSAFDEYYPLEQDLKDIDASRFNAVYASRDKRISQRLFELSREGRWKIMYIDNAAIIAVRAD